MQLTQAQKDALNAGASMEEVLAMAGPSEDAADEAAALAAAKAAETAASAAQTPTDNVAPTVESLQAQMTELNAKLATAETGVQAKDAELVAANAKLAEVTAKATASDATVNALAAALSPYVSRMSNALSKPIEVKGMAPTALVEAHASLAGEFAKAFPAGRQSKSASNDDTTKATAAAIDMAQAKKLNF